MRKLCAREKHTKRGTLPLAAFVALLVAMAAGLAAPSVGYAGEISDPAATDYTTISSQSEDEDLIAQYPELATTILTQMVNRKDDVIDVSSYNINESDLSALVDAILVKHPELFDVEPSWVGPRTDPVSTFKASYLFTDKSNDVIFEQRQKMARGIAHAMSWIPANGTDLEKAKAAQDFLVAHVSYDSTTFNSNKEGSWSDADPTTYGTVLTEHDNFYPYCAYGPLVEHSGV